MRAPLAFRSVELLLIRHGLPVRTDDARTGQPPGDPGLSQTGHREARDVADWLRCEPVRAVYSSPMQRARETAEPLSDLSGLDVRILDGIAEWDRDAGVYVHIEDLQARDDPVWHALARGDLASLGVDPDAFQRRVVEAMDTIIANHRSQVVAVYCHGGVINAYTAHVAGLATVLWFSPDYGGISRVRASSSGTRSIVSLNETGHLTTRRR